MTEYRLAATEYRQIVSDDRRCPECGQDKPGDVIERRYRHGDVIDVSGSEEARLLAAGALAPLAETSAATVDDESTSETDVDKTDGSAGTSAASVATGDGEIPRPRKAGPVAEWVAYAISKGIDQETAQSMTKSELIAAVGEG